jgi:hypothetical protein
MHGLYYDLTNVTKLKIQFNTITWTLCGLFFWPKMSHSLVHMPYFQLVGRLCRLYCLFIMYIINLPHSSWIPKDLESYLPMD